MTDLRTDETNDARMARLLRAAEPTKLEWNTAFDLNRNSIWQSERLPTTTWGIEPLPTGSGWVKYQVGAHLLENRIRYYAFRDTEKIGDGFLSPEAARMACERYETLLRRGERP